MAGSKVVRHGLAANGPFLEFVRISRVQASPSWAPCTLPFVIPSTVDSMCDVCGRTHKLVREALSMLVGARSGQSVKKQSLDCTRVPIRI